MLHLYCIVPASHPLPQDCRGIDARPPFAVHSGSLAVWATEHADAVAPGIEVVRMHNAVIAAAMDSRITPIPLRFGQTAPDSGAAEERLAGESAKWTALLARFAGRAEYGVRVLRYVTAAEQDVHTPIPESGTEYMAALARKQAQAGQRRAEGERIASSIASRVEELVDDSRVEYASTGELLVAIANLVAWTAAERYHGAMREVCEVSQDTQFVLTGPWPPYSFVE